MADIIATATKVNQVLGSVLIGAGQINQLAGLALGLFGIYKQARDQWKASHPDEPDPFLTDSALIDLFQHSAQAVVAEADRLLGKYQAATPDPDQAA